MWGTCRWGTSEKLRALKAHTKDGIDYVGIAADETHRFEKEKRPNRVLPLRDWALLKLMHSSIVTQKALFGMRME